MQSFRRLKIRHILFLVLLASGIVPLVISNAVLIGQTRGRFEAAERTQLTQAADALSREVGDRLGALRTDLTQLGRGLLVVPGPTVLADRLREPWAGRYLQEMMVNRTDLLALRVLDADGSGMRFGPLELTPQVQAARDEAFATALAEGRPAYRFGVLPPADEPVASVAVPVEDETNGVAIVEGLVRLPLMEAVFRREAQGEVGVALVGRDGRLLWSEGGSEGVSLALDAAGLAGGSGGLPLALTTEYRLADGRLMLAQVSPVAETGWAVVVQKPAAAAYAAINRMVVNAALATVLLIFLALLLAVTAARWLSRPIQRLAETSHEIAGGNFAHRVQVTGSLSAELADLGDDFNRMSAYLEDHVQRLQQAARINRELFIGSLRAFAAAIDAKDPYTKGHSERVAAISAALARHLGLAEDVQQTVWTAGLLHDVGKIGVDDRILRKAGGLTDEEFDQMKRHTVIGERILKPIEPLREVLPAIRWHHEAWNGTGYPDGKKGEAIPLLARIVAVADTFDAVTTNRPYQKAFTLEEAVDTITRLTGRRFDARVVTAFLRAVESGEVRPPSAEPAPKPQTAEGKVHALGPLPLN